MRKSKILAGLSAAALAATVMAAPASAYRLSEFVHPSETDTAMNDSYYAIGGMAFFMNQNWSWNQSEWVGIDDAGKLTFEYSISPVLADTTVSGKGTLGDMGVMITNLPEDIYPVDVVITDAQFVTEAGDTIVLDSINSITSFEEDAEGGIRIHIRPTDDVDEETGEVKIAACPEVAGWEQEGAFNGGTLSMTIDFGIAADMGSGEGDSDNEGEDSAADSAADSEAGDSAAASAADSAADSSKASGSTTTSQSGGTTTSKSGSTTTATTSSAASDNTNVATGAAVGGALAAITIASVAIVVARKRK